MTLLTLVSSIVMMSGCRTFNTRRASLWMPGERTRAMWVWNTKEFTDNKSTVSFVKFCRRNRVGLVFLHLPKDKEILPGLVGACRRSGIRVHALTGSPQMAQTRNHNKIRMFIDEVLSYNSRCCAVERISGIHLDVEPYLLKEFSSSREEVLKEYKKLINIAANQLTGTGLLLGVDIPFWLDKGEDSVSEHVIQISDYTCVMAYRNKLHGNDAVIGLSRKELDMAAKHKSHLFVGVETGAGKGIPGKTTFANKGRVALNEAVTEAEAILSEETGFAGMAIHHYKSWSNLN